MHFLYFFSIQECVPILELNCNLFCNIYCIFLRCPVFDEHITIQSRAHFANSVYCIVHVFFLFQRHGLISFWSLKTSVHPQRRVERSWQSCFQMQTSHFTKIVLRKRLKGNSSPDPWCNFRPVWTNTRVIHMHINMHRYFDNWDVHFDVLIMWVNWTWYVLWLWLALYASLSS